MAPSKIFIASIQFKHTEYIHNNFILLFGFKQKHDGVYMCVSTVYAFELSSISKPFSEGKENIEW